MADLCHVDSEVVVARCRHELAVSLEEVNQLCSRQALSAAGAELLVGAETLDDGVDELLFC